MRRLTLILTLIISLPCGRLLAQSQITDSDRVPLPRPVHITAVIDLFKVYDINTVDETFKVDGYFSYSWHDDRMKYDLAKEQAREIMYLNNRADILIETVLWFPEMEFINTLGKRDVDNKAIIIHFDGQVEYVERFHATLKQELEYQHFPFDEQDLKIEIEPFIHDVHDVVIDTLIFKEAVENDTIETIGWDVVSRSVEITHTTSSATQTAETVHENVHSYNEASPNYAHVDCVLRVKRNPGYYLWQLIFPLMIIMLASIVILFITDFGTQIGVGFTLMLTVVAFNFFSETLLPKLPYNTYIEVLIMLGYLFILLCIFIVVFINRLGQKNAEKAAKLNRRFQLYYPIALIVSILVSSVAYFGTWIFKFFTT